MATNRFFACTRMLAAMLLLLLCSAAMAQNDDCSAAIPILLPNAGYGTGTVTSATTNFSSLTIQAGESFAAVNNAAGQNQQSAWYRFSLPTPRAITLSLAQPGSAIGPGTVGLAVYKTVNCLPASGDLSTQLLPLTDFGSTGFGCLGPGTYLVQVVGKSTANGPVFLQLQASAPGAAYDAAPDAADLGLAGPLPSSVLYPIDCQSLESPFEVCGSLANSSQYSKSSWQVFSTPDVFNSLLFTVNVPSLLAGQKIGLRLFDGDLRYAAGNIVVLCDSLVTDANGHAGRVFACNSLRPNRVYSAVLFFYQDFNAPVEVSVSTDAVLVQNSFQAVCSGNSYLLPWGTLATTDSVYADTLRTVGGCDSLIRNIRVKFDTSKTIIDTTIYQCPIQDYSLPWGQVVNAPGVYNKTYSHMSGCDSILYTVRLLAPVVPVQSDPVKACAGSSYTLPWGPVVSTPGQYRDTLRNTNGCDSLVHIIDLSFSNNPEIRFELDSTCGSSYILPWGTIVTASGVYIDTIRSVNGCDSIINQLQIRLKPTQVLKDTISLCGGNSYTLPWGEVVNTGGTYSDTLRYPGIIPCDSLVRQVVLFFNQPIVRSAQAQLCAGGNYSLPWGMVVNSPGIYRDTIKNIAGCDSLVRSVDLVLQSPAITDTSILLCEGATYTLPWGAVADRDSIYTHNMSSVWGCDSLKQTFRVHVQPRMSDTLNLVFCPGQVYTLPWGEAVNTAGTYRDTLHYTTGCDSLVRVVQLSAYANAATRDTIVSLCPGTSYTLPWGIIVNTPGVYKDTLRSIGGCDSLVKQYSITVNTVVKDQKSITSCTTPYLLPWGQLATTPGIYMDTLSSAAGCDSLVREIDLSFTTAVSITTDTTICQGQVYTWPDGSTTSIAGTFRDTVRTSIGCDSIWHSINLTVLSAKKDTTKAFMCSGTNYTLPWGQMVSLPGSYSDTLQGMRGCDSLVRTVVLQLSQVKQVNNTVNICQGSNYMLPWGTMVTTAGRYADTLRYVNGCDSSIHSVQVNVLSATLQSSTASFCSGASYTLPWGITVNTPGIYRDTIRYTQGCDSLVRSITLSQKQPLVFQLDTTLCPGRAYQMPNGEWATANGIYRDTVRSKLGCDSLIYATHVTIASVQTNSQNLVACSGFPYSLPWGTLANNAGEYRDTLRSARGCDSLVQIIYLFPDSLTTSIQKSNDISCLQPSAQLSASGGNFYAWSPAEGLDDAQVYNPVASPTQTTLYQVQITKANGCISTDTITVWVGTGNLDNAFLVPNAFTPDGDGKNDCFGVRHWGSVSQLQFTIYNRWGELVFQTKDPSICWDGKYKGIQVSTGTYVYMISALTPCGPVVRKGTITLIR